MHHAIPIITGLIGLFLLVKGIIGLCRAHEGARQQCKIAKMAVEIIDPLPLGKGTAAALESMRRTDDQHDARRSYPEFYIFPGILIATGIALLLAAWWMW